MGIASGGIGAICGNPADVALVRMTVDNRLPVEQRRNYTSGKFFLLNLKTSLRLEILSIIVKDINFENLKAFNAWRRIIVEEGVTALWTGCRPTVARAMLVNACQLSFNTQAKYQLKKFSIGTF